MARAVWTPLAALDLEDILFYIRVVDGRPETSRRIGLGLLDCADQQATRRESGQRLLYAPADWLYVRYKRWLIFYQPHTDGIEVMRVIDAARDLPSVLNQ